MSYRTESSQSGAPTRRSFEMSYAHVTSILKDVFDVTSRPGELLIESGGESAPLGLIAATSNANRFDAGGGKVTTDLWSNARCDSAGSDPIDGSVDTCSPGSSFLSIAPCLTRTSPSITATREPCFSALT